MDVIERARELRKKTEELAENLTDQDALDYPELFPQWESEREYKKGEKVRRGGVLYTVLQDHIAQANWKPEDAASLFAKVLIQKDEDTGEQTAIPEWEQPSSTNPYGLGDKVTHNGKTWISLVVANVWEPGATGTGLLWKEITT